MSDTTKPFKLHLNTASYLDLPNPARINDDLDVVIANHSYLPHPEDRERDWVASVATPSFKLIRKTEGILPAFASIGTGSGIDAISAVESLGASRIGITDLHTDVVESAEANIRRNVRDGVALEIDAGVGDLLSPLKAKNPRYDLIYENLPNVTLPAGASLADERLSSGHADKRKEEIPEIIRKNLLELHYLALVQAKDFLTERGSVIATIGARVPLRIFEEMGQLAGFKSTFHAYTWKTQDTPDEMLRRYDEQQKEGYGPFIFYRADVLRTTFAGIPFESSGEHAHEIEKSLAPHRLDAVAAREAFKRGEEIGHTAAVVRSRII